jgi:hypothetical protein
MVGPILLRWPWLGLRCGDKENSKSRKDADYLEKIHNGLLAELCRDRHRVEYLITGPLRRPYGLGARPSIRASEFDLFEIAINDDRCGCADVLGRWMRYGLSGREPRDLSLPRR